MMGTSSRMAKTTNESSSHHIFQTGSTVNVGWPAVAAPSLLAPFGAAASQLANAPWKSSL
jgi:hypothetical protein